MAEYGLIGGFVLLVCIVGCMTVGTNLQAWFLSLKSDFAQHAERAHLVQMEVAQAHQHSAEDTVQNQDGGGLSVNLGDLRTSSSNPDVLCGKDFCVNAPGLTGTTVATAGSNGDVNITNSVARMYSQFANIMEQKGADPNTVDLLTNLANTGHQIAAMQNTLKNQRTLYRAFTQGTASVQDPKDPYHYQTMQRAANGMSRQLGKFHDLSSQLDASIDQYPEDARPLLTGSAQVVMTLGKAYHFGITPHEGGQKQLKFTVDTGNIQLIHSNSNTICDNGGDQSKCHWGDNSKPSKGN
jgi:Flp pilus assembly pilin Flp